MPTYINTCIHTGKDRSTDIYIYIYIYIHVHTHTYTYVRGRAGCLAGRWMAGGWAAGWLAGWMDEWMDSWIRPTILMGASTNECM